VDAVIGIYRRGAAVVTQHRNETRNKRITALPTVGTGILAAVLCLIGHAFAPIYATGASILVAVVTGTVVLTNKDMRNAVRSALVGVFLGVIVVLAFYWISALVNLE